MSVDQVRLMFNHQTQSWIDHRIHLLKLFYKSLQGENNFSIFEPLNVGLTHIFVLMDIKRINISDIESDISAILLEWNAVLIDLTMKNISGNPIIQVFADNEKGINAEELAEISKKITKVFDTKDQFPKNYRLDVSSPGIDRPLKYLWQYKKNIGRDLEITFQESNKQNFITGTLESVDNEKMILKTKKQDLEIPFPQILKAVVQIRFK